MSLLATKQLKPNEFQPLYTVPNGKKGLFNVTCVGPRGGSHQVGVLPAEGTSLQQVSGLSKPYQIDGEYPISFMNASTIYPTGIRVLTSSIDTVIRPEKRFYVVGGNSVGNEGSIWHLRSDNRLTRAGSETTVSPNLDSTGVSNTYVDDPDGEVFSDPTKVCLTGYGDNIMVMASNGDVWAAAAAGTHTWLKHTSAKSGIRADMEGNPDDYIPLGGHYHSSYYVFFWYVKSEGYIYQVNIVNSYWLTPSTTSWGFGAVGRAQPALYRAQSGVNENYTWLYLTDQDRTPIWRAINSAYGTRDTGPYWSSSSAKSPASASSEVRVVGIGHNSGFSTTSSDYFVVFSDGSAYGATSTANNSYYANYQKRIAYSEDDFYGDVTGYFAGNEIKNLSVFEVNGYRTAAKSYEAVTPNDLISSKSSGVASADLVGGSTGHAAYSAILLSEGDTIQTYSKDGGVFTITGILEDIT